MKVGAGEGDMTPYYETELGKLYHGDCLEIMPMLEPVDLVLTDPPYVGIKGNVKITLNNGKFGIGRNVIRNTVGDIFKANLDWTDEVWRLSSKGLITFCVHSFISILDLSFQQDLSAIITWFKNNTPFSVANMPHYQCEYALVYRKSNDLKWRKLKTHFNIPNLQWITKERITDEENKAVHRTQKPISLFVGILLIEPETVLDPFIGTGTTAIACERLNRRWIGIEISEDYCRIAKKRIEKENQQLKLF